MLTEPSTTLQPAIAPILETLKICKTSALPMKFSLNVGFNLPLAKLDTNSISS